MTEFMMGIKGVWITYYPVVIGFLVGRSRSSQNGKILG